MNVRGGSREVDGNLLHCNIRVSRLKFSTLVDTCAVTNLISKDLLQLWGKEVLEPRQNLIGLSCYKVPTVGQIYLLVHVGRATEILTFERDSRSWKGYH